MGKGCHPPYQKSAFGHCNEQLNKAAPEHLELPFAVDSALLVVPDTLGLVTGSVIAQTCKTRAARKPDAGLGTCFYKSRIKKTRLLVAGCSSSGLGPRGMSIMLAAGARESLLDSRFDIAFGLTTNGG